MGAIPLNIVGNIEPPLGQTVMYQLPISNNGVAVVTPTVSGSYQYTSWGEWSGNIDAIYPNQTSVTQIWRNILVVRGQATDPAFVPTSGSATYNGEVQAFLAPTTGGASVAQRITGNIQLNANFSANLMGGQMTLNQTDGNPWLRTSLNGGQIFRSDSARFSGQFTTATDLRNNTTLTVQGGYYGSFYGPSPVTNGVIGAPPEVGGNFGLSGPTFASYGVFRGRR
jgi:hypothetical protein